MLATSQGLADATASAKVALVLSMVGFFAGLMLTAAGCYLVLPAIDREAIPAAAVVQYELARLPYVGPAMLPEIAAKRPVVAQQSPRLHAAFDAMPFNALLGGFAGLFMLPIAIAYLKGIQIDRKADAGRLNPLIPRR